MGIKEDLNEVKEEISEMKRENEDMSFAMELLKDQRKQNKRLFVIILVILSFWFATIGYLVYVLNDIGVEETTITQENEDGYNNYIGNDGDITNGKADN